MKLTPAQRRTLEIAKREGSLILRGLDRTENVSRAVAFRLANRGLLKWRGGTIHGGMEFVISAEGEEALR